MQGGAWAVQGGGKVRDRCVGRVGRMGCQQGWVGSASGAPVVDLGQLAPTSRNERMKVTSDLQVRRIRKWKKGDFLLYVRFRMCSYGKDREINSTM